MGIVILILILLTQQGSYYVSPLIHHSHSMLVYYAYLFHIKKRVQGS